MTSAELLLSRGNASYRAGDTDQAIAYYTEAIATDPTFALAYFNRSLAYEQLGDVERAEVDRRHAIALDERLAARWQPVAETTASGLLDLGNAAFSRDDLSAALEMYEEAARFYPGCAQAHYGRGLVHEWRREWDAAIAAYSDAIGLDPSDAAFFLGRSHAHEGKGDRDWAARDREQALLLDPSIDD
jgi:tetratricopeptide (TPR) repeat protein